MPTGLGLRFVAETEEESRRVFRIVTSLVTLDLLSYGYEHQKIIQTFPNGLERPERDLIQKHLDSPAAKRHAPLAETG